MPGYGVPRVGRRRKGEYPISGSACLEGVPAVLQKDICLDSPLFSQYSRLAPISSVFPIVPDSVRQ